MSDRLLEWFVGIMFRLELFFNPGLEDWLTLCDLAGLNPIDPFPELRDEDY